MGVGGATHDGNKELDRLIAAAMTRDQVTREWHCNYCTKSHKDKARITRHVEVHFPGYTQHCMFCGKELISRNALRNHISDVHTTTEQTQNAVLTCLIFFLKDILYFLSSV